MTDQGPNLEELTAELAELKKQLDEAQEANRDLNERVLELYTLYNVSRTLSMTLQLGELFELAMNVIGQSLGIAQYCLMLFENSSDKLVIQASHGMPAGAESKGIICMEEGVSWKVAQQKSPILISDISKDVDFLYFQGSGITGGSYLGVPLVRRDGKVMGVLSAHKDETNGFKEADLTLFNAVAEHVAMAIDNALTFQQTRELMNRDELTSLFNRRYFFERFEREVYRAKRYKHPISILMVDIDHFKKYNDTFGHLRGDEALKKLSVILEKSLRKADVLARYGGEEFLILLPETEKKGAASVGEKLRAEVEKLDFNEDIPDLAPAQLTVTIGVSCIPEDTEESMSLIDIADKALYYGKAKGRNQVSTELPEKE